MRLSGKTPLLRAIHLEKLWNIKRIYIKLEGANPTHHKYARIAETLCKDALAHQKTTILAEGTNAYLRALEFFTDKYDLDIVIPRFKQETWKTNRFPNANIIDLRTKNRDDKFAVLQDIASSSNYYFAMEGYTNRLISLIALEEMTEEIIQKQPQIDTLFTQFNIGYTLSSMYSVLLREWIEHETNFPKLYCGVNRTNQLDTDTLGHDIQSYIHVNPTLKESSKRALKESYGKTVMVEEEDLKYVRKVLREKEHIKISQENAYPIAAFYKRLKNGDVEEGRHVIVLDDARSRVDITIQTSLSEKEKTDILKLAKTYLAQYSDPIIEMKDAIENATEKGYILIAKQQEEPLGVCIIVNTQFDEFIPTYHLAYIGTDKTKKGRGIGTELINRAVDLTNGNLSLHVDLDNRKAKKLYEKMGFKHKYNRMIYYGE